MSTPSRPENMAKRGPKPTPIEDRISTKNWTQGKILRSYTREEKLAAIKWIVDRGNWVELEPEGQRPRCRPELPPEHGLRAPTNEVAAHFRHKMWPETVGRWWRERQAILHARRGSRKDRTGQRAEYWPELEAKLFSSFCEHRDAGNLVSRAWMRRRAKALYKEIYGSQAVSEFIFSFGWFRGFLNRWSIARRLVTNVAQKQPTESLQLVNSFLRYVRKKSQPRTIGDVRRFKKGCIINLDETPVPFEFLEGYTYDFQGSTSVRGKTARSGWGKRQATLILYVFADGSRPLPPKLMFHGSSSESAEERRQRIEERKQYPGSNFVTVEFNPKAYNNESYLLAFLENEFVPYRERVGEEFLFVLDQASFHRTAAVLNCLKKNSTTPAVIPGGCTGLLQPLDTAINRSFKELLRSYIDWYTIEERADISSWSASEHRIMITHAVAAAWQALDPNLIEKAFRQTGISLLPDGSEDRDLKIKGFEEEASFAGWEADETENHARFEFEAVAEVPAAGDDVELLDLVQAPQRSCRQVLQAQQPQFNGWEGYIGAIERWGV